MKKVANALSPDPRNEKAVIFEASPGRGLLTEHLINEGLPHIHVFDFTAFGEKSSTSRFTIKSQVEPLCAKYPDKISLYPLDTCDQEEGLKIQKMSYYKSICSKVHDILPALPESFVNQWEADPVIKCFIPLPPGADRVTSYQILRDLISATGLFSYGRTQFLLVVSYVEQANIIADFKVNNIPPSFSSIVLKTMFDAEILDTLPWNCFEPEVLPRTRVYKLKLKSYYQSEHAFLLRITPKKSLIHDIPMESWQEYFFFVSQSMFKSTGYVIPFFERWFPACGPKLIKAGLPIYSKFQEIKPEMFMTLFKECLSWPEYSASGFKHVAHSLDPLRDEENKHEEDSHEVEVQEEERIS